MRKNSIQIAAAFAVALATTPAAAQDGAGWNPFRWVEDLGVEVLHCDPQMGKSWTAAHVMNAIRICRVEAEQAKAVTERETQAAMPAQESSTAKRQSQ